jgi:mono/diheme cytochrome c family protein
MMISTRAPLLALVAAATLGLAACKSSGKGGPAPGASGVTGVAGVTAGAVSSGNTGTPAPASCAPRGPRRLERRAAAAQASSAVELVSASGRLYALVADFDEQALHVVDTASMQQVGVTPLAGRPGHVLALGDGRVAVALRDAGKVVVLEPAPGDDGLRKPLVERCSAEAPAEPWALAEAGDGLLVASGVGATLTRLRAADLRFEREIALPREPRSVLVTDGGATAFVTHAAGGVVSVIDLGDRASHAVAVDLRPFEIVKKKDTTTRKVLRQGSQGYALAAVTGPRRGGGEGVLRIFAPYLSVDPSAPEGTLSGYGNTGPDARLMAPTVSVIDPLARHSITTDVANVGRPGLTPDCKLPRGAAADARGLFVACADLDAVLELDPGLGDPMIGERRRFVVPAGPGAVALDPEGKSVFVWSEFDRGLSRLDRATGAVSTVALWRRSGVERGALEARIDRGRRLFHTSRDARLSLGRACAACHPDGRDDGVVWTSPDGPRQTPSLAGRLDGTAPYGWLGESSTVKQHVRRTFERLKGTGLDDNASAEDLEALLAYVAQIPAPPAVRPAEGRTAERGKAVFESSGCAACHKGGGTDGLAHDVGSGNPDHRKEFDTPSLRGVRGSAPYFHDGRYATLEEMLTATDTRMITAPISDSDRKSLIAYLETL